MFFVDKNVTLVVKLLRNKSAFMCRVHKNVQIAYCDCFFARKNFTF